MREFSIKFLLNLKGSRLRAAFLFLKNYLKLANELLRLQNHNAGKMNAGFAVLSLKIRAVRKRCFTFDHPVVALKPSTKMKGRLIACPLSRMNGAEAK